MNMNHYYTLTNIQEMQIALMNAKVYIADNKISMALDQIKLAEHLITNYEYETKFEETITNLLDVKEKLEQDLDEINQWL